MDNIENRLIRFLIRLCTNYCYCINIGSDINPAVLYQSDIGKKKTISVADIVADPIIRPPLYVTSKIGLVSSFFSYFLPFFAHLQKLP